jgi:large repetitive protein
MVKGELKMSKDTNWRKVLLVLVGLFALAAWVQVAAAAPRAICVPWNPAVNANIDSHYTYSGATTRVKGIARGDATQYRWDFGDGTPVGAWLNITNSYNLGASHAYAGTVGQTFVATLYVRNAAGEEAGDTYRLKIHTSSDLGKPQELDVRINMAIDEGLWYLHTTMGRSTFAAGSPGYSQPYGWWDPSGGSNYDFASDGAGVDAFQLHGSKVNGDYDNDPYVETVQRGINYLLYNAYAFGIGAQPAGNPDTNGNGFGIVMNISGSITDGSQTYIGGLCMATLASSGAPNRVASVGRANIVNRTFKEIVQDMCDFFAWGQVDDPTYRGGWRYYANQGSSDMSTTQWPALGLLAAEQNMGCVVPQYVRNELVYFLTRNQYLGLNNENGAFGYDSPTAYLNLTKAGAGIICLEFLHLTPSASPAEAAAKEAAFLADSRAQKAIGFIYRHWNDTGGSWDHTQLRGNSYGMYGVMKGFRIPNPDTLKVTEYNYNTDSQTSNVFDWYYTPTGQVNQGLATYCVATQQADGQWDDVVGANPVYDQFSTAWRVMVLLKGVTIIPPTAVICDCDEQEYNFDQPVILNGSCSFHEDSKKQIVMYEWDIEYDGGLFDPDMAGADLTQITLPGYADPDPDNYNELNIPVALRVTDNEGEVDMYICSVNIHEPPHCPHAFAYPAPGGGVYRGFVGVELCLDASRSRDPDNEIASYEWDLDGDGLFGAEDAACFGEASDAVGINPCWTWHTPFTGPVRVRVCDFPTVDYQSCCDESSDVVTVDIGDHAPIANPGGPYVVMPGGCVTLDGSGSTEIDPGDMIVSYKWDFDNDGEFDDAAGVTVDICVPAGAVPGTQYPVSLKVTDSFGETNTATAFVRVIPPVIAVGIDIYPGRTPNQVILSRNYTIPVVVFGTPNFVVTTIDHATVWFGRSGTQAAAVKAPTLKDMNGDGRIDALYGFLTFECGFQMGNTSGILTGKTTSGININGSDSVLVKP